MISRSIGKESVLCLLLLAVLGGCNRVPNFVLDEVEDRVQEKNPFLTITSPGDYFDFLNKDTLKFAGTEVCTVKTTGSPDSVSIDSLYVRIIPLNDTIILRNDRIFGLANIRLNEITGWLRVLDLVRGDADELPKRLYRQYAGETLWNQLVACVSYGEQLAAGHLDSAGLYADSALACADSDTLKNSVLKGFNRMKDDVHFMKKFKYEIESFRNLAPLEMINREFIGLRRLGIFTDDSGAVRTGALVRHEEEKIKWFNISLIVSEIYVGVFSKKTSFYKVLPLMYQRGPNLANIGREELTRFFYATDSALYQYWYRDTEGFHTLSSDTLVMPYQPESEMTWEVTPLYWTPFKPIPDKNLLSSLLLQGRAKLIRLEYRSTDNSYLFAMNSNYVLHGNSVLQNKPLRVSGFITINNGYSNTLDYLRTYKESEIHIEYVWDDGKKQTYKNYRYLDFYTP